MKKPMLKRFNVWLAS